MFESTALSGHKADNARIPGPPAAVSLAGHVAELTLQSWLSQLALQLAAQLAAWLTGHLAVQLAAELAAELAALRMSR